MRCRRKGIGRLRSWLWGAAAVLLAGVAGAGASPANQPGPVRPSTEEVEAAYLYNFGKFVRWPEEAGHGPMVICVSGQTALARTVARVMAGEQIDGRRLESRTVGSPDRVAGCSILYLGNVDGVRLDGFLNAAGGKPVLTVGDAPGFLDRGGVLQFVMVGDHVRFSVNLDAAARNRLWLSSELLKVSVSVRGSQGNGGAR